MTTKITPLKDAQAMVKKGWSPATYIRERAKAINDGAANYEKLADEIETLQDMVIKGDKHKYRLSAKRWAKTLIGPAFLFRRYFKGNSKEEALRAVQAHRITANSEIPRIEDIEEVK